MRPTFLAITAMTIVSLVLITPTARAQAADPDCQFCELPGGEYLNAIYEGNFEKQDRMA
tara:strand:- start:10200 stop:10376 length:177 start_codon:yes stop_codon:yes gene_type:complete